ncbi:MAG: helicase-exonuclease AddAB subunit AddA, partial [Clostridiales bacterium]|nr:helicase-exonuclease AddAB subunit AddA [Clostridiales bacterium]
MAGPKWTKDQEHAITARGGTLLVSAAAGSGKTAVLVQRVIERLTDPEHPVDADRLLIVTFTRAAAAEMKERITARLAELAAENPRDSRIQRQQMLLSRAHISTIHRFCMDLAKEHFFSLGISPDFRIADESELAVMQSEAMETVLETLYARGEEPFLQLTSLIGGGKNDIRLANTILTLYTFVRSHPFPQRWMEERLRLYDPELPVTQSEWGKTVLRYTADAADYCAGRLKNAVKLAGQDEKVAAAYTDALTSGLERMHLIEQLARDGSDFDRLGYEVRTFGFDKFKPVRGCESPEVKDQVAAARDEVKKTAERLARLFSDREEEVRSDLQVLGGLVRTLFEAVRLFSKELDRVKQKKSAVDFSDLEQFAVRLLVKDGEAGPERTDAAREIAGRFDEVLVDEYQDTNEAQDMIFRAVSQDEQNLFMVGDVKQSIYRFRQAMPEIFLAKKLSFAEFDGKRYPACITLGKNFRSRDGVTGAVNFVFSQLMSRELGELDYTGDERLIAGASYPQSGEPCAALHVLDLSDPSMADRRDEIEARHIARYISGLVSRGALITDHGTQRPVRWRDFCILLRNPGGHAQNYVTALSEMGIPAWADVKGGFFGTVEVSWMLSFLRVIDNPVQDVPLCSVLMSPLFGFTPDDMAAVRLTQKGVPLYTALVKKAEAGDEKCAAFLETVGRFRSLAAVLPADRLIGRIYEETGCLAMVQTMEGGELRRENLRLLLEYARKYESAGHKGLSGFIRFIDRLQEKKSDLTPASALTESADVVRVMSIHRSKGLEFPVCILAGLGQKFNKSDLYTPLLLHPQLGAGMMRLGEEGQRFTTLPREAIALELERGTLSEEMRVLYVAMTRAKEKLVMVMGLKNPEKVLTGLAGGLAADENPGAFTLRRASGFSDWLLTCALRHPDGGPLRELAGAAQLQTLPCDGAWEVCVHKPGAEEENCEKEALQSAPADEAFLRVMKERLNWRYPHEDVHGIPAKVTVTELLRLKEQDEIPQELPRPAFLDGQGMTAAQRGTALH